MHVSLSGAARARAALGPGYTQQQLQGLMSQLQLPAAPQPRPPPPFPQFANGADLAPPAPRPFAPPPPQRPSPLPSLQQQQQAAQQLYAAQAAQQAQAQAAARGAGAGVGAGGLLGAPGRAPAYDPGAATRHQLLAQLHSVPPRDQAALGNAALGNGVVAAGGNRQQLMDLGRQLARAGITVEQAVNSGLLGGFSAFDVRSLTEGHNMESNQLRGEQDARLAQDAAQSQAHAQQQAQTMQHQQLLRAAQVCARAPAAW